VLKNFCDEWTDEQDKNKMSPQQVDSHNKQFL
jgi:hypothetical protein